MSTAKLTEQLKRHEGLRLKPYLCTAGKLTADRYYIRAISKILKRYSYAE